MDTVSALYKGKNTLVTATIAVLLLGMFGMAVNLIDPRLFLFLLFLGIVMAVFFKLPWALMTLAIVAIPLGNILPITLGEHLVINTSLTEVFVGITFILVCGRALFGHAGTSLRTLSSDSIFWLATLYLILAVVSFSHIVDAKLFFFELRVILFGYMAYVVSRIVFDTMERARWFFFGLSGAVLVLALQVFFLMSQHGYSISIFYDRNLLVLPVGAIAFASALLALSLPAVAGSFLLETSARTRLFTGTAFVFGFTALLLMLSKGAIASFVLAMLFILWKTRSKVLIPILSALGAVIVGLFLFSPFLSGLVERSLRTFVDVNSQYRILEYQLSWNLLHEHWLFGVGVGQQPVYFQKIYYPDFINFVNNYLLQGWLDLGIAGLLLLAALTVVVANKLFALVKGNRLLPWAPLTVGLAGSCIAAFFNGLVEVTIFGLLYAILLWSFLGIVQNLAVWKKSQ